MELNVSPLSGSPLNFLIEEFLFSLLVTGSNPLVNLYGGKPILFQRLFIIKRLPSCQTHLRLKQNPCRKMHK